jgi:hypothetical protein
LFAALPEASKTVASSTKAEQEALFVNFSFAQLHFSISYFTHLPTTYRLSIFSFEVATPTPNFSSANP